MTSKTNPYPEPMTLDKLAEMVAKGFEHTASREDLYAVESRLGNRIDGVEERLDKVENRLTTVEGRLTTVENKLDKALYKEIARLDNRITKLQSKA